MYQSSLIFPMSFAQQRLWLLEQINPNSAVYNICWSLRMVGPLDDALLLRAIQAIADRHEALRTTFGLEQGAPVQIIHQHVTIEMPVVDVTEAAVRELALEEARRPFDLTRGPLLRVNLLRLAADEHVLLLAVHHLVFDGWSMGVFCRDLSTCMTTLATGQPATLPELEIQYVDYASWQRQELQGTTLAERLEYWQRQLHDAPPLLDLPTDWPRSQVRLFEGARHTRTLPEALATALNASARQEGATLFMLLLATFNVLLHRYTNQTDIVIGTPTSNRPHADTAALIGFFVNMLVLRTNLSGDARFRTVLAQTRQRVLDAFDHQDLPFESLVEAVRPERSLDHTPLFQVVFAFQDDTTVHPTLHGLNVSVEEVDTGTSKFDLNLTILNTTEGLQCRWTYTTDLFSASTIARLADHFETLLAGVAANPAQRVGELPMVTAAERELMLVEWNATARSYPVDFCIHELFEAQVARTPGAIAVVCDGETLSYQELNEQANQLAHHLVLLGVGPGSLVAIYMDRTPDLIVALLGVLKAGGAYVPQEPSFPSARVRWILNSLEVRYLITQHTHLLKLDTFSPPMLEHVICLDERLTLDNTGVTSRLWSRTDVSQHASANLPPRARGDDLAYIIFTSGSTGTPKGVMIQHSPVINLIEWVNRSFQVNASDHILFVSSVCFDLSVYDVFGLLAAGGAIQVVPNRLLGDPHGLLDLLCTQPITFWDSAPAALQQLAPLFSMVSGDERTRRLRLVFLSGDWIPVSLPDAVRNVFPAAQVIALGGATEATVWSNYYPIGRVEPQWPSIPYGRPIQNSQYHILDHYLNPCPVGVSGDLYIAGTCLALGYSNEPALTADKFIPNPFSVDPAVAGTRLYKTGDRARYWADGTIEFLGRIDQQVKIRGFRIELGEIEAALRQHPAVHEAVAMAREDTPGNKRLVAYVVPQPDTATGAGDLQAFLRTSLPEYMVPSACVFLETLPVTSNGKLDRRALPAPEDVQSVLVDQYVPPSTPTEQALATMWAEVLGLKQVGIHDNFFVLGGHSLLALQIVLRVRDTLQVEMSVRAVFEDLTIAALALTIDRLSAGPQLEDHNIPTLTWGNQSIDSLLDDIDSMSAEEVQVRIEQAEQQGVE